MAFQSLAAPCTTFNHVNSLPGTGTPGPAAFDLAVLHEGPLSEFSLARIRTVGGKDCKIKCKPMRIAKARVQKTFRIE